MRFFNQAILTFCKPLPQENYRNMFCYLNYLILDSWDTFWLRIYIFSPYFFGQTLEFVKRIIHFFQHTIFDKQLFISLNVHLLIFVVFFRNESMPRHDSNSNCSISFEKKNLTFYIFDNEGHMVELFLSYCSLHNCCLFWSSH